MSEKILNGLFPSVEELLERGYFMSADENGDYEDAAIGGAIVEKDAVKEDGEDEDEVEDEIDNGK